MTIVLGFLAVAGWMLTATFAWRSRIYERQAKQLRATEAYLRQELAKVTKDSRDAEAKR